MSFPFPPVRPAAVLALALVLAGAFPGRAAAQFEEETRTVTRRGTTAAEFLTIPVGARATAMGNAISASVDDATAIYWNAAGLTALPQGQLVVEYAQWLAEIDFNYAALALPTSLGTLGFGVTSMRSPQMEVTTVEQQNGTGETFDAASYAFALSFARALTDRFSIGMTGKYVTERIAESHAGGFAIDIGTMFVTPFRDIRLGASISNFGTKMQITGDDLLLLVDIDPNNRGNNESNRALLRTDPFDLPLVMRIGLAGELYQTARSRVTLAIDALSPSNSEQYVNVGAEVGLLGDLVLLRGGYSELFLPDALRSLTLGGGLRYAFGSLNLGLDYAFEAQEYFGAVNRFTMALQF